MRVDVDEARGHQGAVGVDGATGGGPGELADGGDAAVRDADVGRAGRRAGAVDDRAAADHEIEHGHSLGCRSYGFGSGSGIGLGLGIGVTATGTLLMRGMPVMRSWSTSTRVSCDVFDPTSRKRSSVPGTSP